jgi:hypothetical protein
MKILSPVEKINKRTNEFIQVVIDLLREKQKMGYDLARTIQEIEKLKV